ncbi:AlpA family transcriptional regulator [Chitinimonas sp. BJYL2]|uniref:helix-turn-helix transcriptional regulator n=1 Tax=Chitinimonas sp. BJYL2 TaxID=2976696 RepID=UPI0027E3CDB7|nr:AlpA family transcriptional regulator [Chitinimonas sp. BJYL2]
MAMRVVKLVEVIDKTGLSRSSIYAFIADGRFPKPLPLGDRRVGWLESEVEDWIQARLAMRDQGIQ